MTWTRFMDMHSRGSQKEQWQYIYIEAPEAEAKVIFFNRFGHNPERVSCTCCGDDYSIDEGEDFAQMSGFDRNCRSVKTPRDPVTKLYKPLPPEIEAHYYLEADENPPEGYEAEPRYSEALLRQYPDEPSFRYQTVEEYCTRPDVLVIRADEIKPEERKGAIPEQGYVWVG